MLDECDRSRPASGYRVGERPRWANREFHPLSTFHLNSFFRRLSHRLSEKFGGYAAEIRANFVRKIRGLESAIIGTGHEQQVDKPDDPGFP